jgi:CBS domain-containing protein
MVKPVITVSPKMDIRYCARLFDHYNILRAPVIENDELLGIVGFSDIVLQGMESYRK